MNRREGRRPRERTNDEFMERVLAVFGMDDGCGHGRERKGKEKKKRRNEYVKVGFIFAVEDKVKVQINATSSPSFSGFLGLSLNLNDVIPNDLIG